MKFRTFSTLTVDFSTLEAGIFEDFVLILFHSYERNRKVWDFHRSLGMESLSIVISEKVRRQWPD
jgi:hypothetical protein